ncbi:MAG: arylamine N-acetyltransferase [Blautia sp.]|nr:arylamine N-acetyltransferase [Blautia sp.]
MHVSIPDIDAYLERIGLTNPLSPDLDTLNRLIYHHHTHIPFEDLNSSLLHESVSLDIPDLYDKIITRRRGGYCFEMNALFCRLLRDLGFNAYLVFCRIIRGRDFIPPCTHCAVIVTLDKKQYFCDVGYGGPMPAGAMLIADKNTQVIHEEPFHIEQYDAYWWTLSRTTSDGQIEKLMQFNTFPQTPQEFLAANLKSSTSPDSVFVNKVLVNLRADNGSYALTDWELTIREGGDTIITQLADESQRRRALQMYFGIVLP